MTGVCTMTWRRLLITACVLVLGSLALAGAGVYYVAVWLQAGDTPAQADAIVVLAGGPYRAFYAADLYQQGYASRVYISKAAPEPWEKDAAELGISIVPQEMLYRQVLVKKGVPLKQVAFFGRSLSTAQEAEHVRRLFPGPVCKLLVVTSPYHVRRTKMIFSDMVPACKTTVVGTPYEPFPERWWSNQDSARNVVLELAKIVYYKAGGRFRIAPEER
jgi:uncharacterized SAM-binding protein YcdF (DUF218 family)